MRKKRNTGNEKAASHDLAQRLLAAAQPALRLPSLPRNDGAVLMPGTMLSNASLTQAQAMNMHGRIFGGFLLRRAFELAWATAYMFGGVPPRIVSVDEVSFIVPVEVGALLQLSSRVLYTKSPGGGIIEVLASGHSNRIHIDVKAFVTDPSNRTSQLANKFGFTFSSGNDRLPPVLPTNMDEATAAAARILEDNIRSH